MTKEIRIFAFTTVLPVLLGMVAAIFSVRTAWQKMLDDEQRDLKAHASLMADAIMSRILASNIELPAQQTQRPHAVSRHPSPPRHVKERNRSTLTAAEVAPVCADMLESGGISVTAFEIRNLDGTSFFASYDWPKRPGMTGECDLGPPLGDKTLVAARADGGADFHFRVRMLFVTSGIGSLFIFATFLLGSLLLVRTIRHERRDAIRKTNFIDNVSHELKTPLAGIRLNAELLAKGRIPNPEMARGAMEAIIVESDRLGKMVDELLDYSRLEKGSRKYAIETFDLAAFVGSPAELQAIDAISQGRVRVTVKEPGVQVSADVNAIRQIGINLVTNALKYSDGDVELVVDGPRLLYMDRGPGIPRGDEERIFERFYRCDSSLSAKTSGSGLGLAIARALARGMGGDLTYSSRPGGGSIFTLSLALAPLTTNH